MCTGVLVLLCFFVLVVRLGLMHIVKRKVENACRMSLLIAQKIFFVCERHSACLVGCSSMAL